MYATLNLFIVFIMVSIAAIIFPFKLKNIFESAPGFVKKRVSGFPVISILGIAGVIVNLYFGYATVQPAITPAVPGSAVLQYLAYASVPLTIIGAFVIYAIAYAYRRGKGVDLGMAFREIPPE